MRLALALAALVVASPAGADSTPPFKAHELSPDREAAWVSAVQDLKTADGTTVMQSLRYAETLRPNTFKVGTFQSVYDGARGEPDGIAVDFWIGAKREPDDAFSFIFEVKEESGKVIVQPPTTAPTEAGARAVASGRDSLLRFIDEEYRDNCIDSSDGAKLC
ncbi:MAG: hypothetical protein ACRYGP_16530 [Janthinobacterium lividum]